MDKLTVQKNALAQKTFNQSLKELIDYVETVKKDRDTYKAVCHKLVLKIDVLEKQLAQYAEIDEALSNPDTKIQIWINDGEL